MSRELVKWQGGRLVKPSPLDENRRVLSEALALLRPPVLRVRQTSTALACGEGELVDLPRLCAVHHGRAYAARYVMGADGRFRHAQTIKVTEALFLGQYADNPRRAVVPARDIADECCPWCGGHGFGSVLCGTCGKEICYGKTVGRYFRCCCGAQGTMVPEARTQEGVMPREAHGGGYAAGGK